MTIEEAKKELKGKGPWDPKALIMACLCEGDSVSINMIKNDNDLYGTSLICDAKTYLPQNYSLDVTMKWINDLFCIERFVSKENKNKRILIWNKDEGQWSWLEEGNADYEFHLNGYKIAVMKALMKGKGGFEYLFQEILGDVNALKQLNDGLKTEVDANEAALEQRNNQLQELKPSLIYMSEILKKFLELHLNSNANQGFYSMSSVKTKTGIVIAALSVMISGYINGYDDINIGWVSTLVAIGTTIVDIPPYFAAEKLRRQTLSITDAISEVNEMIAMHADTAEGRVPHP